MPGLREQILALLSHGHSMTAQQIKDSLGNQGRAVETALQRLKRQGYVRLDYGHWGMR